jgi:hypothetical protein
VDVDHGRVVGSGASSMNGRRGSTDHDQEPGHADEHADHRRGIGHDKPSHEQDQPEQGEAACRDEPAEPEPLA